MVEDVNLFADNSDFGHNIYEISALPDGGFMTVFSPYGNALAYIQFFDGFGASLDGAVNNFSLHKDFIGKVQAIALTDDGFVILTMEQAVGFDLS